MIKTSSVATKNIYLLLDSVTVNMTSDVVVSGYGGRRIVKASIAGTGAVAASVALYGNIDPFSTGVLLATLTLSGTTTDQAGADIPAEWPYMYCVLSGISGTNAAVSVSVGA
jgi:hypothetical protein